MSPKSPPPGNLRNFPVFSGNLRIQMALRDLSISLAKCKSFSGGRISEKLFPFPASSLKFFFEIVFLLFLEMPPRVSDNLSQMPVFGGGNLQSFSSISPKWHYGVFRVSPLDATPGSLWYSPRCPWEAVLGILGDFPEKRFLVFLGDLPEKRFSVFSEISPRNGFRYSRRFPREAVFGIPWDAPEKWFLVFPEMPPRNPPKVFP